MKRSGGVTVLMLLLLTLLFYRSREVFPREGLPVFFIDESPGIFIQLEAGYDVQRIHQFSDEIASDVVIQLTVSGGEGRLCQENFPDILMRTGEALKLVDNKEGYGCFERSWMPAGKRMALGIPLHPDRMIREDWEALPGIGPRLAERIETDRQLNGDFEVFQALERVRGIGPRRIDTFREFFVIE